MVVIYDKPIIDAFNKVCALTDYSSHNDITKRHEFKKITILNDKSLTKDVISEVIQLLDKDYDYNKILYNEGKERLCDNCNTKCLATLYCEHCVRNYLKSKFSNWTSGNDDIDNLLQKCQIETLAPDRIVEWIPYDNLRNVSYLTKGGCSEIYSAEWIEGDMKNEIIKKIH